MSILFQGGTIITSTSATPADVLVDGETILQVGPNLDAEGAEVVDVSGKLLFPGFIDGHTHLDMQGATTHTADNFHTATASAVAGGVTSVIDFATPDRGESLVSCLKRWHELADDKSYADYAFHMSLVEWNDELKAEIPAMFDAGISSFKVYMAYDNLRIRDREIMDLMESLKGYGGMLGCHCENGDMVDELIQNEQDAGHLSPAAHPDSRPPLTEAEAVNRFLTLAKLVDLPVNIVHLSSFEGLTKIREARAKGQKVFLETCPQYLIFDDSVYHLPDFESAKYVCSPPLRPDGNRQMLWEAVEGGEVDTISTDHCAFNFQGQKEMGRDDFHDIPNGMPGVEHRPIVMYTAGVAAGRLTPSELAALCSENIAKQFGMFPQKGILAPGSDADIVVWDPDAQGTISAATQVQDVDYTPYEGFKTVGAPVQVYLRGRLVAENGKPVDGAGGKYIARGRCF